MTGIWTLTTPESCSPASDAASKKLWNGCAASPTRSFSHLDQHPADGATELFEEERDEGLAERLQEELAALERAEGRLEEGTYGVSIESGQPIPDERLEAIPWAERTAEEQQRFEGGA